MKDTRLVLVFILIFGAIVSLTSVNIDMMTGDAGNHATGGLLVYELANHWISNPASSLPELKDFAINHHAHYKSFASFMGYAPFHPTSIGLAYILFGASRFTAILVTIIESMVLLFFTYKLSGLCYRDKKAAFLAVFLLAFSPLVFYYSGTALMEIAAGMFLVITIYCFSRYLMEGNNRYLYFTAIACALAILTKPPVGLIIPVLFLALVWDKRLSFSSAKRNFRPIALSVIMFFLLLSPWITGLVVLQSQGLSGTSKWEYIFLEGLEKRDIEGFPLMEGTIRSYGCLSPVQNFVFYVSSILYNWYLVPFFVLAFALFLKKAGRLNLIEKEIFLMVVIFFVALSIFAGAQPRFMVYTIPFILIPTSKAIMRIFKRIKHPVVIIIMILAIAQCSHFSISTKNAVPGGQFDEASIYIIEDTAGGTTVVSSAPRAQAFSFALLDREREVYMFYLPSREYELKQMINRSYSESEWEQFNVEYPPVNYIIVHEFYTTKYTHDYDVLDFLENQGEFRLAKTFEGDVPNARTFIYKRGAEQA
jgi:4-amino-4-deoxy-L-arabinose transferase-like glycosyltransferase